MYELKFIGANESKDRFAIFELDEKQEINIYLWVFPYYKGDNRVDVGYVTRVYSYLNHGVAPLAVREDECGEIIVKALEVLEEYPKEVLMDKIKALDEALADIEARDGDWFEEWDEAEAKMFQEIEKARVESGYWPWEPKSVEIDKEFGEGQKSSTISE